MIKERKLEIKGYYEYKDHIENLLEIIESADTFKTKENVHEACVKVINIFKGLGLDNIEVEYF